jgi:hypothetical protein
MMIKKRGKPFQQGHKVPKTWRKKISNANKGKIAWNKDKKLSEKHKKKIGLAEIGNNKAWKGDKAKKEALHLWVAKRKPKPELCEFCNEKKDWLGHSKLELANIKNHKYTRKIEDYKWGHLSCHRKYDGIKPCKKAVKNSHILQARNREKRRKRI